jgi:hypothetical protein
LASSPEIIDAFREAATHGASVVARREGDVWEVSAVGRAGDGRRVAWVPSRRGPPARAPPGLFIEGLNEFFGDPIGREVSRQLGLREDSEQALEAREVLGALEMAVASQQAFAGLNFLSRHAISARGVSPQFRLVCMAMGVLPDRIPPATLSRADELFEARFEARRDGDRRGVDLIEARLIMGEVLVEILSGE